MRPAASANSGMNSGSEYTGSMASLFVARAMESAGEPEIDDLRLMGEIPTPVLTEARPGLFESPATPRRDIFGSGGPSDVCTWKVISSQSSACDEELIYLARVTHRRGPNRRNTK